MKVLVAFLSCAVLSVAVKSSGKEQAAKKKRQDDADCDITKAVRLSFYGKAETSGSLAYSECGRINAGGRGTYDSPLTMAAAPGAFKKCEIIFVPYLLKYVRFEDLCADCVPDWADGKRHIQIWTGGEVFGGEEQVECERSLAPTHGMAVIRNPGHDYRLDSTPLYSKGATTPCRMDHRYSLLNNELFCYGRREKTAPRRKKKKPAEKNEEATSNKIVSIDDMPHKPKQKATKSGNIVAIDDMPHQAGGGQPSKNVKQDDSSRSNVLSIDDMPHKGLPGRVKPAKESKPGVDSGRIVSIDDMPHHKVPYLEKKPQDEPSKQPAPQLSFEPAPKMPEVDVQDKIRQLNHGIVQEKTLQISFNAAPRRQTLQDKVPQLSFDAVVKPASERPSSAKSDTDEKAPLNFDPAPQAGDSSKLALARRAPNKAPRRRSPVA